MQHSSFEFLKRLLDAPVPSGFEAIPAGVWRAEAATVADEVDRLARRIVRQAEDREVGGAQALRAGGRVLATDRIDLDQREVVAAGEPLADLEPGRAGLAVDVDARLHRAGVSHGAAEAARAGQAGGAAEAAASSATCFAQR